MTPPITVQKATASNTEEVKRLYDEVIAENTGTKYDVLWRRDLHPSDASIEQAIAQGQQYIAYRDGQLIGTCILDTNFASGYESIEWEYEAAPEEARCLHLFCTHPSLHGQGLGAQFLKALFAFAKEEGVKVIRLDVFDYNDPAKHLYEKVGFRLADRTYLQYEDQEVSQILFAMFEIKLEA